MSRQYNLYNTKVHGIRDREDLVKSVVERIGYGRWRLIAKELGNHGIIQDKQYKFK